LTIYLTEIGKKLGKGYKMKGNLTKITLGLVCLYNLSFANDNISKSLKATNLAPIKPKYQISRDAIESLKNRAVIGVANSLNIDSSLFDKKRKFSLYLKISRNSKFGFRYKF
jgi:hypothetical protein